MNICNEKLSEGDETSFSSLILGRGSEKETDTLEMEYEVLL